MCSKSNVSIQLRDISSIPVIPQIDTQRCARHIRAAHPIKISWHFAGPQDLRQRRKESNSRRGQSYSTRFPRLHHPGRNQMCGKLRILAGHLETRFAAAFVGARPRIRQESSANKRVTSAAEYFYWPSGYPFCASTALGGENRDAHVCAVTRELEGRKSILENDNSLALRMSLYVRHDTEWIYVRFVIFLRDIKFMLMDFSINLSIFLTSSISSPLWNLCKYAQYLTLLS